MPPPVPVEGRGSHSSFYKITCGFDHCNKRSLSAVKDISNEARSKLHHQNFSSSFDRFPNAKSNGVFIDLYDRLIFLESDYLSGKPRVSNLDDFVYTCPPHLFRDYDGPRNPPDLSH